MGHFLKLKCAHSLLNLHVLSSTRPIYTHDGASAKFSTKSHETDYNVPSFEAQIMRVSEVSRKNKKGGVLSSQMITSHDNTR